MGEKETEKKQYGKEKKDTRMEEKVEHGELELLIVTGDSAVQTPARQTNASEGLVDSRQLLGRTQGW